jgi:hypothetical protein
MIGTLPLSTRRSQSILSRHFGDKLITFIHSSSEEFFLNDNDLTMSLLDGASQRDIPLDLCHEDVCEWALNGNVSFASTVRVPVGAPVRSG